jgi:uncharacterized protein involved in response to NO
VLSRFYSIFTLAEREKLSSRSTKTKKIYVSLIAINKKKISENNNSFFSMGFRPFFLGACIFSLISITLWTLSYSFHYIIETNPLSPSQLHSHEMVFGYCMAVIAGFLLTAVPNWTGIQGIKASNLVVLFTLWSVARTALLFGTKFISLAAISDTVFVVYLIYLLALPIFKTRQWRQSGVLSKLLLLLICNSIFYLSALELIKTNISLSIHAALYLVIGLILTIASRVLPAFIENGVEESVKIANPKSLATLSMLIFLIFFLDQIFIGSEKIKFASSALLFLVTVIRLKIWHTPGIWSKPLLWSLYLAIAFIALGFLLISLTSIFNFSAFLALHAFAYGAIGLATLGMMPRVILGHSGKDINSPPRLTQLTLILITLGAITRVFPALIQPQLYLTWIITSQIFWILGFFVFIFAYAKVLLPKQTQ